MKIKLDAVEDKVRNILLQYAKEFAQNGNPSVTLRFTGGWVRDKLLNRPSHDIDVAIDKSTGEEFATGLHNYMVEKNLAETKVYKVAVNPEKSKHLETAMTRICGLDIDFVNLRSEEYASDSRVPTKIKFGTPEEDAFRRDATLNALFYNLTTSSVEDFTGRGLDDLHNGVLRTPLDPHETFRDDPLRVLRLLRFVGQLNFTLDAATEGAMTGDLIGPKIRSKVSGERIGKEMEKMLAAPYSVAGMQYLASLRLAPYIFAYEPETPKEKKETKPAYLPGSELDYRLESMKWLLAKNQDLKDLPTDERCILWLATLLQNLSEDDVGNITQQGLKLTKVVKEGCIKLVRSISPFDNLKSQLASGGLDRIQLGMYVRDCGKLWPLTIPFHAARLHAADQSETVANEIKQQIINQNLAEAYTLKPLVAGKELMTLLKLKPGPGIAKILEAELHYLLENPEASKESTKEWLCEKFQQS